MPSSGSEVSSSEEGKEAAMIVSDEEDGLSDVPSLATSASSDSLLLEDADGMLLGSSDHSCLSQSSTPASSTTSSLSDDRPPLRRVARSKSEGSAVSFSPRVCVRVFERPPRERDRIWYTPRDMDGFKREALERVQQYYLRQGSLGHPEPPAALPAGAGRAAVAPTSAPAARLLFSHQALQAECDVLSSSGWPADAGPGEPGGRSW
jgi:hypothetical protein